METSLTTARFTVRTVRTDDAAELFAYHDRNRDHLRPWEPEPPPNFFTLTYWERFTAAAVSGDEGHATRIGFLVREAGRSTIVASVNLQSIERGVLQRAILGYSVDGACTGRGYASEAVSAVIAFGFETLRLHRIEANYQPSNERSGRLLRKLGFVVEGYARDYLFLNGGWRDHVLTSLTNPRMELPR